MPSLWTQLISMSLDGRVIMVFDEFWIFEYILFNGLHPWFSYWHRISGSPDSKNAEFRWRDVVSCLSNLGDMMWDLNRYLPIHLEQRRWTHKTAWPILACSRQTTEKVLCLNTSISLFYHHFQVHLTSISSEPSLNRYVWIHWRRHWSTPTHRNYNHGMRTIV